MDWERERRSSLFQSMFALIGVTTFLFLRLQIYKCFSLVSLVSPFISLWLCFFLSSSLSFLCFMFFFFSFYLCGKSQTNISPIMCPFNASKILNHYFLFTISNGCISIFFPFFIIKFIERNFFLFHEIIFEFVRIFIMKIEMHVTYCINYYYFFSYFVVYIFFLYLILWFNYYFVSNKNNYVLQLLMWFLWKMNLLWNLLFI